MENQASFITIFCRHFCLLHHLNRNHYRGYYFIPLQMRALLTHYQEQTYFQPIFRLCQVKSFMLVQAQV